ncbi:homeodomain-interacting protein kinase 1-like isoform X1 [Phyllopteryx taeniolatus]|uniref:homeodomain-interacting protein kinase 1-like isoform X1 n=1 Tax=Phyllopteryx taeniolatus TaxID=161469 RepID=UPI002AD455D8|nr:homeodomain-interacting protein kinase 1-like isoform X1 [Phyllopteryx taeniolatus]
MEIKMLGIVSVLDPVKKSIVKFIENFEHEGYTCLAFEMLDMSLFDFVVKKRKKPLSISEIRPIAHQLLTAFEALKAIRIIHADLKPDNIMLVNHSCEPFRVKLIDFGCSLQTSAVTLGMTIQPMGYRAPEVSLGLPISEQVDMWGLGCALTFLHIGQHLFATNCEYQMMSTIVQIRGQPADSLLLAGKYSEKYFTHLNFEQWKLKTPNEYKLTNGEETKTWKIRLKSLDVLKTLREESHRQRPSSIDMSLWLIWFMRVTQAHMWTTLLIKCWCALLKDLKRSSSQTARMRTGLPTTSFYTHAPLTEQQTRDIGAVVTHLTWHQQLRDELSRKRLSQCRLINKLTKLNLSQYSRTNVKKRPQFLCAVVVESCLKSKYQKRTHEEENVYSYTLKWVQKSMATKTSLKDFHH